MNRASARADYSTLKEGTYDVILTVMLYNNSDDANDGLNMTGLLSKSLEFELEIGTKGGIIPFIGAKNIVKSELQIQVLARAGPFKNWGTGDIFSS